jgi:hypothetical protein
MAAKERANVQRRVQARRAISLLRQEEGVAYQSPWGSSACKAWAALVSGKNTIGVFLPAQCFMLARHPKCAIMCLGQHAMANPFQAIWVPVLVLFGASDQIFNKKAHHQTGELKRISR